MLDRQFRPNGGGATHAAALRPSLPDRLIEMSMRGLEIPDRIAIISAIRSLLPTPADTDPALTTVLNRAEKEESLRQAKLRLVAEGRLKAQTVNWIIDHLAISPYFCWGER
jgi:hypothetical protein